MVIDMLAAQTTSILAHIDELGSISAGNSAPASQMAAGSNSLYYQPHTWGGRMHPVPENYLLPSYSVKDHWNLWYFGNKTQQIGSHRSLQQFDLVNTNVNLEKRNKTNFCRIKMVMHYLMDAYKAMDPPIASIDEGNSDELFGRVYSDMLYHLYGNNVNVRAFSDHNIHTVYEKLRKSK